MVFLPLKSITDKPFHKKNHKYLSRFVFVVSLISFIICSEALSQRKADFGVFAGISWYQGDINSYPFYSPGLATGPVYRYNFHPRASVRFSAIFSNLSGDDMDFQNEVQQLRAASFQTQGIDFAGVWEHNFLPYQTAFKKTRYSPYVFAGIGYHFILSSNVNSESHFTIPFGLGFKWNINKRLSAGIENSFRKTYNDRLDGVENFSMDEKYRLLGNKDWYSFTGFFLSFKFFNFREDCPAYD